MPPRGNAKRWDDEDVLEFFDDLDEDDVDEIAEESGREANALWLAAIISPTRGKVVTIRPTSTLKWNPDRQKYINSAGGIVTRGSVKKAVEGVVETTTQYFKRTGQQLMQREMSINTAQRLLQQRLTAAHALATALARGGKGQLSEASLAGTANIVGRHYDALGALMKEIENGTVSGGRAVQRLGLMSRTVRGVFHEAERALKSETGFDQCKRVLSPGESCEDSADRDGCVELAAEGWIDIDDMTPIGDATCLANCRCDVIYRIAPVDDEGNVIEDEAEND